MKLAVGYYNQGVYKNWTKDRRHRLESKLLGVFRAIWPIARGRGRAPAGRGRAPAGRGRGRGPAGRGRGRAPGAPLPWRLTKQQLTLLDERMSRVLWPHYIEALYYEGASFWKNIGRLWKIYRKVRLLYYILPAQLRDQIPAVRKALYTFVWAMRRLDGQVHSWQRAQEMGILPGSRTIDKTKIGKIHSDLIRGLCLLEGCVPISHLNPALHHFVHYAQYTRLLGLPRWYWMMSFERCVRIFLVIFIAFVWIRLYVIIIHSLSPVPQVQQTYEKSGAQSIVPRGTSCKLCHV